MTLGSGGRLVPNSVESNARMSLNMCKWHACSCTSSFWSTSSRSYKKELFTKIKPKTARAWTILSTQLICRRRLLCGASEFRGLHARWAPWWRHAASCSSNPLEDVNTHLGCSQITSYSWFPTRNLMEQIFCGKQCLWHMTALSIAAFIYSILFCIIIIYWYIYILPAGEPHQIPSSSILPPLPPVLAK